MRGCWWRRAPFVCPQDRPFESLRANGFGKRACGGVWGMRSGTETPRAAPLWIPAFAGMTRVGECEKDEGGWASGWGPALAGGRFANRPYDRGRAQEGGGDAGAAGGGRAPFDRLRANGFGRGAYNGEWGMRWGTGVPRAPHLWIPAFAGMTRVGVCGKDEGGVGVGVEGPFDRLRANGFGRGACGGVWGMRWGTETPCASPLPWVPARAGTTMGGVVGCVGARGSGQGGWPALAGGRFANRPYDRGVCGVAGMREGPLRVPSA